MTMINIQLGNMLPGPAWGGPPSPSERCGDCGPAGPRDGQEERVSTVMPQPASWSHRDGRSQQPAPAATADYGSPEASQAQLSLDSDFRHMVVTLIILACSINQEMGVYTVWQIL